MGLNKLDLNAVKQQLEPAGNLIRRLFQGLYIVLYDRLVV